MEDFVELNVGGKIFKTEIAILKVSPFFVSLLTDKSINQKKSIFIDRDPTYFQDILSLMRSKTISLKNRTGKCTNKYYEELKTECEFYHIDFFQEAEEYKEEKEKKCLNCRKMIPKSKEHEFCNFHSGRVVKGTLNNHWNCCKSVKTQLTSRKEHYHFFDTCKFSKKHVFNLQELKELKVFNTLDLRQNVSEQTKRKIEQNEDYKKKEKNQLGNPRNKKLIEEHQCLNCGEYFNKHLKDQGCRFHRNIYRNGKWKCCGASKYESKGCVVFSKHCSDLLELKEIVVQVYRVNYFGFTSPKKQKSQIFKRKLRSIKYYINNNFPVLAVIYIFVIIIFMIFKKFLIGIW